mgnify:CR=1 FL=1
MSEQKGEKMGTASTAADVKMQLLAQVPGCDICFEDYNDLDRKPHVLHCGHTLW